MYIFWLFNTIKTILLLHNLCGTWRGVTSIGRRKLDERKLVTATWTHATIGRVRQLDGGRMRHALKLFHNI
jgi:hypothetical protein